MMSRFSVLTISILLIAVISQPADAQENNGWIPLAGKYSLQDLSLVIIPREQWHPYPLVQDPAGFGKIPEDVKQEYIKEGESLLNAKWPRLPATTFLEFKRNRNRSNYEMLSFQRRQMLPSLFWQKCLKGKAGL